MQQITHINTRPRFLNEEITYPDSDGEPMAENTKQFEIISMLHGGIDSLYNDRDDVFVAGDLFWYPVEGNNKLRLAPDVMVVFGRPRGHRGSYMQWKEEDIAPQVVIEVLSPSNRPAEMMDKLDFYDTYGVEEYLMYDPETLALKIWRRTGGYLRLAHEEERPHSVHMNLSFHTEDGELVITRHDGRRFETFRQLFSRAEMQHHALVLEQERAEQEKQRAEQEKQRAEQEKQRAERLAAQLRAAGIVPDDGDAAHTKNG
ncbi:MAG: Uma2 family endonuclease [Candidatus Kapaibacterium sp.]|nr:MAG: Uma2 family endonuclease [Candidatus Kapabacteria bacterium]